MIRTLHSSCTLNGILYVFGGFNRPDGWLNSIESLDARRHLRNVSSADVVEWMLFELKLTGSNEVISGRSNALMAPISSHEILIMGGYNSQPFVPNFVIDVEKWTSEYFISNQDNNVLTSCNQCKTVVDGKVVGLVENAKHEVYILSVTKNTAQAAQSSTKFSCAVLSKPELWIPS